MQKFCTTILKKTGRIFLTSARLFCPFPCPCCGKVSDGVNFFCSDCKSKLRIVKGQRCPGCGGALDGVLQVCSKCIQFEQRPWDGAFAVFELRGLGQQVVHRLKFYNSPELARPLAVLAAEIVSQSEFKFDCVVPVPLHWSRCFYRGYNQAELLCEELSRLCGIPCRRLLRRVKRTRQQAKLDRDERRRNLQDAFALSPVSELKSQTILLVDDVMTTGATLSTATEVLKKHGVARVFVLIVGRR
ncbi:ComF family protein [Lentisphaerota bacterium ZTH]|nr:ComF family protein [Lentisphaerota bacterium]WET07200.1 ComF family protein [Lentisphaerota bacterium ZTH]